MGNKTNVNDTVDPTAEPAKGLSIQQPIDKAYVPRTSNAAGKPNPPKAERAGKFTFK